MTCIGEKIVVWKWLLGSQKEGRKNIEDIAVERSKILE
jgi:hypothetical protein